MPTNKARNYGKGRGSIDRLSGGKRIFSKILILSLTGWLGFDRIGSEPWCGGNTLPLCSAKRTNARQTYYHHRGSLFSTRGPFTFIANVPQMYAKAPFCKNLVQMQNQRAVHVSGILYLEALNYPVGRVGCELFFPGRFRRRLDGIGQ